MPEAEQVGLFIHFLGVFAVAGSTTTFIFVLAMLRRSQTAQEVRLWARLGSMSDKIFPAGALVLLLSGGYLVSKVEGLSFDDGWLAWSTLALIAGVAAWLAVNTRKIGAIVRAAREAPDGALPRVLAAQVADPLLFGATHAITTAMVGVIWNMTTQPGSVQSFIVVVLATVAGAASAAPMVARRQRV